MVKNHLAKQEMWVRSLGREDPQKKEMATHSSILAWDSHGQRSLVGCSPWGRKESDTTEQLNNNIGRLYVSIASCLTHPTPVL